MARSGTIARLVHDRGFGFIQPDEGGEDIFFHATSVEGTSFDLLASGQRVEYEQGTDPRTGRGRAEHVRIIG